jgi:cytidylate kinase
VIIGIAGKMQSGKDTLGAYLIKNHDYNRRSFATNVRSTLTNINLEANRENMQFLAQALRSRWPDVWVEAVQKDLLQLKQFCGVIEDKIIITDVRYPNEVSMVRRLGGKIIHLLATADVRWQRHTYSEKFITSTTRSVWDNWNLHSSELALDFARSSIGDVTIDTTHKTPKEIYIEALDKLKYHEAI